MTVALERAARKSDIVIGDRPGGQGRHKLPKKVKTQGRLWKHSRLADLHPWIDKKAAKDLRIITIARNPWDRLVSYYHWLRAQNYEHKAVALAQAHSFRDFAMHEFIRHSFRQSQINSYLYDTGGAYRCNLHLCLETLSEEWSALREMTRRDIGQMPHVNRSQRAQDYRGFYDADLAAQVAHDFAPDIAQFGYRFDVPTPLVPLEARRIPQKIPARGVVNFA